MHIKVSWKCILNFRTRTLTPKSTPGKFSTQSQIVLILNPTRTSGYLYSPKFNTDFNGPNYLTLRHHYGGFQGISRYFTVSWGLIVRKL